MQQKLRGCKSETSFSAARVTHRGHSQGVIKDVFSDLTCQNRIGSLTSISSLFHGFFVVCLWCFFFSVLPVFIALVWVQGPARDKRNVQSQSSLLKTDWPLPGLYYCSVPRVMEQFLFWVSLFTELCSARNINYTHCGQSDCNDAGEH